MAEERIKLKINLDASITPLYQAFQTSCRIIDSVAMPSRFRRNPEDRVELLSFMSEDGYNIGAIRATHVPQGMSQHKLVYWRSLSGYKMQTLEHELDKPTIEIIGHEVFDVKEVKYKQAVQAAVIMHYVGTWAEAANMILVLDNADFIQTSKSIGDLVKTYEPAITDVVRYDGKLVFRKQFPRDRVPIVKEKAAKLFMDYITEIAKKDRQRRRRSS